MVIWTSLLDCSYCAIVILHMLMRRQLYQRVNIWADAEGTVQLEEQYGIDASMPLISSFPDSSISS